MRVRDELVSRCALRRAEKIGGLSDQGFAELVLAVREDPASFADTPDTQALVLLGRALDAYDASVRDDDLRGDDEYAAERERRRARLREACEGVVAVDPDCLDALAMNALLGAETPDAALNSLMHLWARHGIPADGPEDRWDDVFARPNLRLGASVARAAANCSCFRLSSGICEELLAASPSDAVGARYTLALDLSRLEDERAFNELDARFSHGNPWQNLARAILLFRLDRRRAAERALKGFAQLSRGGTFALLRPVFVEQYLPDRPDRPAGSFEEALCCVSESEPYIADVPDFIWWCEQQPWVVAEARAFAEREGLDW